MSTRIGNVDWLAVAAAALCSSFALPAGSASATPVLGLDLTSAPGGIVCPTNCEHFTLGWNFVTADSTSISALGIWDEGGDGLGESHDIGLWSSDGTLLASTTVTPASAQSIASASGLGAWVLEAIPTLTLEAGAYSIGALYTSGIDPWRFKVEAGELQVDPLFLSADFTFVGEGDTLAFPDRDGRNEAGYFGPNLVLSPEPSTGLLLGLGLLALTLEAPASRLPRRPGSHEAP